jgi:hypothetical protein
MQSWIIAFGFVGLCVLYTGLITSESSRRLDRANLAERLACGPTTSLCGGAVIDFGQRLGRPSVASSSIIVPTRE